MVSKRPTSADVAALAGVSRTTVSFVMNDRTDVAIPPATRLRVRIAAEQLGYHPNASARQLAAGASRSLGLVLRQSPEQVAADALLAETLRGVASAARGAGYRILVEPLTLGEGHYASLLHAGHTDGLIVSGPRSDDTELAQLAEDDAPIVIQGSLPGIHLPSVDVDNRAGAALATDHLLSLGHRRIAFVTNAPLAYTAAVERLAGYRDALARSGIEYDPDLVAEADFDPPSGRRAMDQILAGPRSDFTAVFVASDVAAFGAMAALRDAGRSIPNDVSMVGFDDIPLAAFMDPPLTTIRLPARDLGLAAGWALIARIDRRPVAARTLLPTELVVRASTASSGGPRPYQHPTHRISSPAASHEQESRP